MLNIHTVQESSTIEANTVHRKKSAIVQNVLILSLILQNYNPHQRLTLHLSNYTTLFSISEGGGNTNTSSRSWEERRSDVEHLRPSEETSAATTEEEPGQRGLLHSAGTETTVGAGLFTTVSHNESAREGA